MRTTENKRLMRLLNFSEEDLTYNREGLISPTQNRRLKIDAYLGPVMLITIEIGIIYITSKGHSSRLSILFALLVAIMFIMVLSSEFKYFGKLRDLKNQQVSQLRGEFTVRTHLRRVSTRSGKIRFVNKMEYYLTVHETEFHVPPYFIQYLHEIKAKEINLHYLPFSKNIVSVEVLTSLDS
jgi:hypothetical protein